MLPADWQARMVEMIRGAAPLSGAWFAPGPWLDPEAQIGVYRQQFQMRMSDALDGELPGLRALMGEALDPLYEAFLLAHPPDSWSLDHLARPFADWLEAQGADRCHVDMARLDAAVMRAFTAEDPRPLEVSQLHPALRLELSPSTVLLELGFSVHLARASIVQGQIQLAPVERACAIAVYRQGLEVRHWEPGSLEEALLRAFTTPTSLEAGLSQALSLLPTHATAVGPALHAIAARQLLRAAADSEEAG